MELVKLAIKCSRIGIEGIFENKKDLIDLLIQSMTIRSTYLYYRMPKRSNPLKRMSQKIECPKRLNVLKNRMS